MKEIKEIAHFVKENMDETQGKQLLNEVEHFDRMVDRFAGVMADLGLWTFMLKAREFDTSGADLIFLDPLTGAVGEISRKFLHDSKGNKLDLVAPARVDDPEAKKLLIDTITTVLRQLTGEDQTDSQQET
ncbi:unnamed protein product [Amoebophrya sp. A25]|nr:unnamed protein product [Amoebophrya sp. A25]|eukprot:GSA25T00018042001.1